MIQFNLLPDVKLEYIKARRTKRFALFVASSIAGTLLTVTVLLFMVVNVFQGKHLSDLNRDIKRDSTALQQTPDINKILTIQSQLASLPALHNNKPVASRLFNYLTELTPAKLSIAELDVDFDQTTMSFTGGADALSTINKFVDTLKFTTYKVGQDPLETRAFSNVVLTTFGRDDKGATYQVDLKFDPAVFDTAKAIKLVVPRIITTRSETEKPSDLFQSGGSSQESNVRQ